jgi:hypothetical protein
MNASRTCLIESVEIAPVQGVVGAIEQLEFSCDIAR